MESLYRKYRPQTFADMVGQKHIVATLRNALSEGREAHAYLFCGPRGTGKTTTARLLAKALLCENGPTPDPDGTCEQCREIAEGSHPDVYELDAASRTGVDNVRDEIINRVAFAPTQGRFKVYIVDEVHMLTPQAFNALLKTLEEPPAHVVFILCTTDPQRVPETILSRCQRLEFHRIQTQDIQDRLAYVCQQEGFSADDEALELIARHSRGGLRDALSLLEQISTFGMGSVRAEDTRSLLGEASIEVLAGMLARVLDRDVAGCFAQVAALVDRGTDIAQYVRNLVGFVRNVYVAGVTGGAPEALDDYVDAERACELAKKAGNPDRLARVLDVLGELERDLRTSLDQRLSLEIALTRIARPGSDLTVEALAERVDGLERKLAAIEANGPRVLKASVEPAPVSVPAGAGGGDEAGDLPWMTGTARAAQRQAAPAGQPGRAVGGQQAPAGQPWQAQTAPAPATTIPTVAAPAVAEAPAAAPAAGGTAGLLDPSTAQRLWGTVQEAVTAKSPSIGALLRSAEGQLTSEDTLTIVNHGSSFAANMMLRADSLGTIQAVAEQTYGRALRIVVTSADGTPVTPVSRPGAPARQAPAQASQQRPQTPMQSQQQASPAPAASAPAPVVHAPAVSPAPAPVVPAPAVSPAPAPAPATATPAPATAATPAAPVAVPAPRQASAQPVDLPWTEPAAPAQDGSLAVSMSNLAALFASAGVEGVEISAVTERPAASAAVAPAPTPAPEPAPQLASEPVATAKSEPAAADEPGTAADSEVSPQPEPAPAAEASVASELASAPASTPIEAASGPEVPAPEPVHGPLRADDKSGKVPADLLKLLKDAFGNPVHL